MRNDFHIQWHITEKCNLNCLHCYKEPFRKELGLKELKFILENIISFIRKKQIDLILTLTGGEPFLKKEIYKLVEYINNFEEVKRINFISNGTVVPKKNFSNLKKISKYYISLESWLENDNDRIRGKGVYKKILNNIKILQFKGYKIGIMTTLQNSNISNLIANFNLLHKFLSEYSIDEIIFERFVPVGNSKGLKNEVVSDDMMIKFYSNLSKYYEVNFDELKNYKAIKINFCFKDKIISTTNIYGAQCTSGKEGVAILSDGTVYPCRRLDIPIGNLLKDSLLDIIPCDKMFQNIKNKDLFNCYAMTRSYLYK